MPHCFDILWAWENAEAEPPILTIALFLKFNLKLWRLMEYLMSIFWHPANSYLHSKLRCGRLLQIYSSHNLMQLDTTAA